jgi:hypothetical protein
VFDSQPDSQKHLPMVYVCAYTTRMFTCVLCCMCVACCCFLCRCCTDPATFPDFLGGEAPTPHSLELDRLKYRAC